MCLLTKQPSLIAIFGKSEMCFFLWYQNEKKSCHIKIIMKSTTKGTPKTNLDSPNNITHINKKNTNKT